MTTSPAATPVRVLMVCTGNICRSQMAHMVLAEAVRNEGLDVEVDSAGVSNEEEGNPIDPRAARVLREAGHPTGAHRARQIRPGEIGTWDLVLAMTGHHRSRLARLADLDGVEITTEAGVGEERRVDLRMFRDFDPALTPGENRDVPDPWYGGHADFLDTLAVVERVTPALVAHLKDLGA